MTKWRTIARNTPKVSPLSQQNITSNINVFDLQVEYQEKTETLLFTGFVSKGPGHGTYKIIATFLKVPSNSGLTLDEIAKGFKPKAFMSKHDVKIRCSCPTYRFRFDKANRGDGCGAGKGFGAYRRKTNRKPNNPKMLSGTCYHVGSFLKYLQKQKFIK